MTEQEWNKLPYGLFTYNGHTYIKYHNDITNESDDYVVDDEGFIVHWSAIDER